GPPEFSFRQVQIDDLPLYNQDDDARQADCVKRLRSHVRIQSLDPGCAEERDQSRFAPLWTERLGRQAARRAGRLGGAIGTAVAQQHLRGVLAYLDVTTLGQPEAFIQVKDELFDEAGDISAASRKFLQHWM